MREHGGPAGRHNRCSFPCSRKAHCQLIAGSHGEKQRRYAPVFSEVHIRGASLLGREPHVFVVVLPLLDAATRDRVACGLPPRDRNLIGVTVTHLAASIFAASALYRPKRAFLVKVHFEKSKEALVGDDVKRASNVVVVNMLGVGNAATAIIYQTGERWQVGRLHNCVRPSEKGQALHTYLLLLSSQWVVGKRIGRNQQEEQGGEHRA